ncbi:transglycosylase SLT domain-containing protein [bacterium]|nr:transglycosylase SLT domain-containing protein [bacterium]
MQDTEMLPLPVELKAKENHARPPMSHRRRSHERPVGDVLPNSLQLQNTAPVGTASAHVSAELPAAVPAAAPAVASPAAIDTNSLKPVQNTPNNAPKSVKIYSRPAAPAVSSSSGSMFDPQNVQLGDMQTAWGYGPRENKYNADILKASQQHWPHQRVPLHPLLFKSLVANESAFNPTAVSYTGATGLTQLTPDTMRRFGLNWSMSRDPQYAVPAGVKVLAEKARVVLEPQNYCKITGMNPSRCSYAQTVAEAYQKLGEPTPEQSWYLVLGAYNAGGGTILRAMARAYKQGKDPRDWDVLVGDANNKAASPLFQACQEIFPNSASAKYKEISEYPGKILKLYRRNQPVAI